MDGLGEVGSSYEAMSMSKTLGVTLFCFGRLKGSQCNLEGWPENSDDLGSCPMRDFTCEQEPDVQPPALSACHLCFIGKVGVQGFKSLRKTGVWQSARSQSSPSTV